MFLIYSLGLCQQRKSFIRIFSFVSPGSLTRLLFQVVSTFGIISAPVIQILRTPLPSRARAGRQGSSEYLDDWRRDYSECGDDLEKEAGEAAGRYEAEYSDERLSLLAKAKGIDQEQ